MSSRARVESLLESELPPGSLAPRPASAALGDVPVVAPPRPEGFGDVLRLAGRERLAVLPLGQGSKLAWRRAPAHVDLALSSAQLAGVTAFEPADGTVTALAGTTIAALSAAVSATHHLSPEVALPADCTLGGVLAAGGSGLDRLRYGPVRHQVLGIRVALADGSLVKSGGRVVKNVTGYDLHRLWCGSAGTLCVLLEATLRLYPRPAREAVLQARFADRARTLERAQALVRSAAQPVAALVEETEDTGGAPGWRLSIVLAGREEVVGDEIRDVTRGLPEAELHEGADAARLRAELRDRERSRGWSPLLLQCRPSRLGAELERLDGAAAALGQRARLRIHPLLASVEVRLDGSSESWIALERALASGSAQRTWRAAPAALLRPIVPSDDGSPGAALQQRLKRALDPQGILPGAIPGAEGARERR